MDALHRQPVFETDLCLKQIAADGSEPMAADAAAPHFTSTFASKSPPPPLLPGCVAVSSQADGATDGVAYSS